MLHGLDGLLKVPESMRVAVVELAFLCQSRLQLHLLSGQVPGYLLRLRRVRLVLKQDLLVGDLELDELGFGARGAELHHDHRSAGAAEARGVDPASVDLDDLLDPEEVRRIERRFVGDFTIRTRLDRYDFAIILCAGLTAAALDFILGGPALSLDALHDWKPDQSPLDEFLRTRFKVSHDNALGHAAHASFDAQRYPGSGRQIGGFRPQTHRDLTLGHDPLLGLIVGTRDIMQGQLTTFGSYGQPLVVTGINPPVADPFVALGTEILHLLSDAFTPMGLPAPGWTALNTLQVGLSGQRAGTIAKGALDMYTQGYDTRHFLTMSVSVVAAELVLRTYWSIRISQDPEYAEDVEREAQLAASRGVSDHPRYQALAFGAHAFAAAANAGKVVLAQNPLLINYPQWQRFVLATYQYAQGRATSPTDVLIRRSLGNADALSQGWPDLHAADPAFPTADLRPR